MIASAVESGADGSDQMLHLGLYDISAASLFITGDSQLCIENRGSEAAVRYIVAVVVALKHCLQATSRSFGDQNSVLSIGSVWLSLC
jgi:hypothetical protein